MNLLSNEYSAVTPGGVTIRQYPFNSPLARQLISELDATYEALYPDLIDDPAHPSPGKQLKPEDDGDERDPAEVEQRDETNEVIFYVASVQRCRHLSDEYQQSDRSPLRLKAGNATTDLEAFQDREVSVGEEDVAGCIALRLFPYPCDILNLSGNKRIGEVKRFYVRPSYRGAGVSKFLLSYLEDAAKNRFERDMLVLEVGVRQIGALKLYRQTGWNNRETYGEWIGAGVEDGNGGISVCFEKML